MFVTKGKIKSLVDSDALSNYLPYAVYDEATELYFSEKLGSACFILEVSPQPFHNNVLIESLTTIMAFNWGKNCFLQTNLYADPNIQTHLDRYMSLRDDEYSALLSESRNFLYKMAKLNCDFAQKHTFNGIDPEIHPVVFRNFRSFISIRVPASTRDLRNHKGNIETLLRAKKSLKGTLKSVNLPYSNFEPNLLINTMSDILNPNDQKQTKLVWDESRYIREQIIKADTPIRLYKNNWIKIGNYFAKSITPKNYSERILPYTINDLIGDRRTSNTQQITCPFLLTTWVNLDKQNGSILKKGAFVFAQSSAAAILQAAHSRKSADYHMAVDMINENECFFKGGIIFTAIAPTFKRVNDACEVVNTIWEGNGFKPQFEPRLAMPMFLSSLPAGVLPSFHKLNRGITAPARTWAMFSSLQADSKGTSTPGFMFFTRRGQIAFVDLKDSDTNFNALVIAPSGAGKSFLANNIITQTLSKGGNCYMFDIGGSYQKLAEMLEGNSQIIRFTEDANISLNLFALVTRERVAKEQDEFHIVRTDKDELKKLKNCGNLNEHGQYESRECNRNKDDLSLISMLHKLLCQMSSPSEVISVYESSILMNTLDDCIQNLTGGQSLSIDMIHKSLQDNATGVKDLGDHYIDTCTSLAERLSQYTQKGSYGKWFKGEPNLNFEKQFVLLELEELSPDPEFREVVLLLLISIIEQSMYINTDLSRHTIVGIDEGWDMLQGANTAPFIETGFRRARKYNASYMVITQSLLDLQRNPTLGTAITNNSAFTFFLQHKSTEIDKLEEQNLLPIDNEYDKQTLKDVHTKKGHYSEVGISFPNGAFAVFRLIVPDETKLLYTTDGQELNVINSLRKMGYPLYEAIKAALSILKVMKEYQVDFTNAYIDSVVEDQRRVIVGYMQQGLSLYEAVDKTRRVISKAG